MSVRYTIELLAPIVYMKSLTQHVKRIYYHIRLLTNIRVADLYTC